MSRYDESKLAFSAIPSNRFYRLRLARYAGLFEAIDAYLQDSPVAKERPLRILEIGPGRGRSLRFFQNAGIDNRLELYGLDISPKRLQSIHDRSHWRLVQGDAQQGLPFPTEHFDICVCEQVLEHLTEPEKVIAEMARVLRLDGLLIVGVPTFPPGIAHLRDWGVSFLDRLFGWKRSHVQTFTIQRIQKMLSSNHPLEVEECRGFRVVSGGVLSRLEDYRWWYRLNRWVGRIFPGFCTEVQVLLRKKSFR